MCVISSAEEIIKEEQAGFRAGRSTTQHIFSLKTLYEKCLQHQQSLYRVFVYFKKALNRVWHAALSATMRLYNIMMSALTPPALFNIFLKRIMADTLDHE